jgi:YD repeat-containing protein
VRPAEVRATLTDAEGRRSTYETGEAGELLAETDPAGLVTRIERDGARNALRTELPSGHAFAQSFDGRGNLLTVTDEVLAGTTTFTYEPTFSQVASLTDDRGKTTSFTYDPSGNLSLVETPLHRQTSFTYTPEGLVDTLTDALGTVTDLDYDAAGNVATITQGSGVEARVTSFTYTPEGLVDTITDPEGRVVDFDYDALGRVVRQTFPDLRLVEFDYDEAGNLTRPTPPGRVYHAETGSSSTVRQLEGRDHLRQQKCPASSGTVSAARSPPPEGPAHPLGSR